MKRLQRYYFYIGIPVLVLAIGAFLFMEEILGTVRGNPHPQINYLIFVLIVAGCVQMILHVIRINREGNLLKSFSDILAVRRDPDAANRLLQDNKSGQQNDLVDVLEMVLDAQDGDVDSLRHAALESEIERLSARLNRRLLLAQYMSGMMVGLGLLGTFIGLLGALSEIGKLIGSFAIGSGTADPIAAVSELVTRLTEPMKAMGIAFSASLFGVLGSLIMGMLMVFIKSATVELVSAVQSRVSWLTDLQHPSGAADGDDVKTLEKALTDLATQSPLLQGLAIALDQSERRARQVLTSVQELLVGVAENNRAQQSLGQHISQLGEQQALAIRGMQSLQSDMVQLQRTTHQNSEGTQRVAQAVAQQQSQLQEALAQQTGNIQGVMQMHQDWLQALRQQQEHWSQGQQRAAQEIQAERASWFEQWKTWSQSQQGSLVTLQNCANQMVAVQQQQTQQWADLRDQLQARHKEVLDTLVLTQQALAENAQVSRQDTQSRTEVALQVKTALQEQQDRHEQLLHVLTQKVGQQAR